MGVDDRPEWLDYLLTEYGYHRSAIDKFSSQRLLIRNWSISVAGAIFAVALTADVPAFAFGSVVSTLMFGALEMLYMHMEAGVIDRSNQLEVVVNKFRKDGQAPDDYEFGVSHAYRGHFGFRALANVVLVRGRLHITGFYVALLFLTGLGALAVSLA